MPEPTRTLLNDMAIAGGCAVLAGALVCCALYPLLMRWADRRSDKVGQPGQSDGTLSHDAPGLAVAPALDGLAPSLFLDDEIAQTVRRVHFTEDR